MVTAIQAHERLVKEAVTHTTETRRIKTMKPGEVCRQGDIYIHCVDRKHPRGKATKTRQLAIGETMGSRHIAEAPAKVFLGTDLPTWCSRGTFLGPCVTSEEAFVISHPEHAHVELPAGTYQVTHQTDARTRERVAD